MVGRRMEIPIASGQQAVNFLILPADNKLADGNIQFTLTIVSTPVGLKGGEQKSLDLFLLDDEVAVPGPSAASFANSTTVTDETSGIGIDVIVEFSKALQGDGSMEIAFTSMKAQYGVDYVTEPPADEGVIVLERAAGASNAFIKIVPINNAMFSGERQINFLLRDTHGSIVKGQRLSHELLITDDELINLPKGYSIGGSLGQEKTYEYDESGRISRVTIESGNSGHVETYVYDGSGKIAMINTFPEMHKRFVWADGRIVRSESIESGILKEYIQYDYDVQGNVSGTANYFKQPDGQYKLSFIVSYLYFTDNNLYKAMYYLPVEGADEFALHSTRTYENYNDADNPFPMVDILPTVRTQNKLPGTFRIEEHGQNLSYDLEYEFRDDGRVLRRYAKNGSLVEATDYFYY